MNLFFLETEKFRYAKGYRLVLQIVSMAKRSHVKFIFGRQNNIFK